MYQGPAAGLSQSIYEGSGLYFGILFYLFSLSSVRSRGEEADGGEDERRRRDEGGNIKG